VLLIVVVAVAVAATSSDPSPVARHASRSLPPYWTVRPGQSYAEIAAKTGLTIDQLESFNPYQDPAALTPGRRIKLRLHVPPPPPKRRGPRFWIVRRGQTFASIAARTHHDTYALQRLNPRVSAAALQPGKRIRLRR